MNVEYIMIVYMLLFACFILLIMKTFQCLLISLWTSKGFLFVDIRFIFTIKCVHINVCFV